ncbi:pilus assembly protein FimV [Hydrogenophaga palleronii]|uniref:Pilus assembly protein FimV n=1 Tax=Hydrogenophaga palleronii TaxID=65655 RepID=A0ABU1WPN1_9BURK|nr:FimV/HubP family polar landmark protein [Hydrogenophaga palleronii]MDR7151233.1 pilus assembly protein FimV [Hydrogenophaga palleronii]
MHSVAIAALLCAGLAQHADVQALALGRIVVQSALGEPLRAQIEIPEINADEASTLTVGLASGDAFSAAGMDFNPALSNLQITLQRRADGRAYLQLSSSRPVTEPFVDLIVEANWSSGRIVRDYTLLFDPPRLRAATPVAPVAPGVSAPARPSAPAAAATPTPAAPTTQQVLPPSSPTTPSLPPTQAPEPSSQVTVVPGDTAGRIAEANRPANVSLDQMLVAMLRSNPRAFIGNNVNRLRAGVVLDLPSAEEASAIGAGEARQVIAAQSRDFNEFRRRLAGAAPEANVGQADRQAAGSVQTEVQDASPAVTAPDRLTLSKEAAPGQAAPEAQIAQSRQTQEASNRAAELSRNIEELAQLQQPAAPPAAAPTAPPAAEGSAPATGAADGPAVVVPGAPATAPDPAAATDGPPAEPAAAPQEPAPPVTPAPVLKPAPVPAPLPDEPSLIDKIRDNPLVIPLAGALLALLAGLGFYRLRQRNKGASVDSSFLESRLQPDSFFGSSGGQRIDTADASVSGSSMVYSPSQLDAAGDVDPVAEADVYLAYGRDLQAEEILKEAMRSTPTRVAIHVKLLEIYAKRRDAKAFEVVATEAYNLTQGQGPEWEHACDMGKELDPSNPLYQPGGSPAVKLAAAAGVAGGALNTMPFTNSTLSPDGDAQGGSGLDLDFSFDDPVEPAGLADAAPAQSGGESISAMDDLKFTEALTDLPDEPAAGPASKSMDFDLDFPSEPVPLGSSAEADRASKGPQGSAVAPTFDESEVLPDFSASDSMPLNLDAPQVEEPSNANGAELMAFDLNELNLDLDDGSNAALADVEQVTEESPLDTKLSLAEEFRAIGDLEGARSLAEEVLAEASGTLKTKARTFLSDLA